MATISINGLVLTAHHGVHEQERKVGNEFVVDVKIEVPSAERAAETDDLNDTINYADIVEIVKHEMSVPSKLIEHVAGRIRQTIINRYGSKVAGGEISVSKLAPPIAAQLESVTFKTNW